MELPPSSYHTSARLSPGPCLADLLFLAVFASKHGSNLAKPLGI